MDWFGSPTPKRSGSSPAIAHEQVELRGVHVLELVDEEVAASATGTRRGRRRRARAAASPPRGGRRSRGRRVAGTRRSYASSTATIWSGDVGHAPTRGARARRRTSSRRGAATSPTTTSASSRAIAGAGSVRPSSAAASTKSRCRSAAITGAGWPRAARASRTSSSAARWNVPARTPSTPGAVQPRAQLAGRLARERRDEHVAWGRATPRATRRTTRWVSTRVLPAPAPARTTMRRSGASIASSCSGVKPELVARRRRAPRPNLPTRRDRRASGAASRGPLVASRAVLQAFLDGAVFGTSSGEGPPRAVAPARLAPHPRGLRRPSRPRSRRAGIASLALDLPGFGATAGPDGRDGCARLRGARSRRSLEDARRRHRPAAASSGTPSAAGSRSAWPPRALSSSPASSSRGVPLVRSAMPPPRAVAALPGDPRRRARWRLVSPRTPRGARRRRYGSADYRAATGVDARRARRDGRRVLRGRARRAALSRSRSCGAPTTRRRPLARRDGRRHRLVPPAALEVLDGVGHLVPDRGAGRARRGDDHRCDGACAEPGRRRPRSPPRSAPARRARGCGGCASPSASTTSPGAVDAVRGAVVDLVVGRRSRSRVARRRARSSRSIAWRPLAAVTGVVGVVGPLGLVAAGSHEPARVDAAPADARARRRRCSCCALGVGRGVHAGALRGRRGRSSCVATLVVDARARSLLAPDRGPARRALGRARDGAGSPRRARRRRDHRQLRQDLDQAPPRRAAVGLDAGHADAAELQQPRGSRDARSTSTSSTAPRSSSPRWAPTGAARSASMCAWCPPDVAVLTAIGPVHLERFGTLERIVEAKAEITERRARGRAATSTTSGSPTLAASLRATGATWCTRRLGARRRRRARRGRSRSAGASSSAA